MNFSPFGGPFSASIPGIHQFTASQALGSINNHNESMNRYSSNGSTPGNSLSNVTHFNQVNIPLLSKYRGDDNLNTNNITVTQKYNGHTNNQHLNSNAVQYQANVPTYTPSNHLQTTINDDKQRLNNSYQQSTNSNTSMHQTQSESAHDICNAILGQQTDAKRVLQNSSWQSLTPSSAVADYLSHLPASTLPLSLHHFLKYSAESIKKESQNQLSSIDSSHTQNLTQSLGLNSLSSSLLSNTTILNQPQQHQIQALQNPQQQQQQQQQQPLQHHISIPQTTAHQTLNASNSTNITSHASLTNSINQNANLPSNGNEATINTNNNNGSSNGTASAPTTVAQPTKKKKKKKPPKEKKPRPKPGEIRLTTALDGSTLFGCPECHMVYPERGLLEEHLVGHNLERRFECDICQARLKRKDHLTRHKQSHNPDRPFVCSVCAKTFKRKEQLTLHFVIHSGEKKHICVDCGKGFYRKDHLRKHTRSHIARRVKAELSQQNPSPNLIAAQQLNQLNSQQLQIQNNASFS